MSGPLTDLERYRGCLLGGAVGDALGAPVEFVSIEEIRKRFGPGGICDFVPAYGRIGAITDDTQMTLFTAEGLLRAEIRHEARGICHPPMVVHHAYLRWLKTQGENPKLEPFLGRVPVEVGMNGWLIGVRALWARRGPGNTCLSALRDTRKMGEPAKNNSKGCGGVMRVAPVGLMVNRERVFEIGSQTAALTHGHPSGYLSAGFIAPLIEQIMSGASLKDSISTAKEELIRQPSHEEVLGAVGKAETLARSNPEAGVEALGQGWIAEEALAIALFCSLVAPNFEEAVVLAVNHSGDSDSTGAITGNICGALYGDEAIPARWIDAIELRDEITAIADDLAGVRLGTFDLSDNNWERYPGG